MIWRCGLGFESGFDESFVFVLSCLVKIRVDEEGKKRESGGEVYGVYRARSNSECCCLSCVLGLF